VSEADQGGGARSGAADTGPSFGPGAGAVARAAAGAVRAFHVGRRAAALVR